MWCVSTSRSQPPKSSAVTSPSPLNAAMSAMASAPHSLWSALWFNSSEAPTELPFTGLSAPSGVAVDTAGNVYVTDFFHSRLVKLAAGSSTQTELPVHPNSFGVAVDTAGSVYLALAGVGEVLKLTAGSDTPTKLLTGLGSSQGVAVDTAGNVYVTGDRGALKLTAGSDTPTKLPFTGLEGLLAVAVDAAGSVYVTGMVTDPGSAQAHGQVVKLAAG